MVLVCSTDTALVESFSRLPLGDTDVRQMEDMGQLEYLDGEGVSLIFIDLKCCEEAVIPSVVPPAIALTEVPHYDQAMRLLRRGIRGYGNRHMHRDNMAQAITAVKDGQVWLPPTIVSRMISSLAQAPADAQPVQPVEPLSRREEEVTECVTEGLSNREIAEKMGITVRTVKAHLTSIFAKTGFRDRLELAVKMKRG